MATEDRNRDGMAHPSFERAQRNRFSARSLFARLLALRKDRPTAFSPDQTGMDELLELNWRRLDARDADDLGALIATAEHIENPPYRTTSAEVQEIFNPEYRLDCLGGFDEQGNLAAYGLVRITTQEPTVTIVTLSGTVHPKLRHRAIGGEVLRWQLARAKALIDDLDPTIPAFAAIHVEAAQDDMRDLIERHGFGVHEEITQLRRPLAGEIPAVEAPASIPIEPLSADLLPQIKLAHKEAFAQIGGQGDVNDAEWEQVFARIEPQWSFVAMDRSSDRTRIAGYLLASKWEEDWQALGFSEGYIEVLGVLKQWRGQGVATSLLGASIGAMQGEGLEYVSLDADSTHDEGARAMFTQLGFTPTHVMRQYLVPLR